MAALLSLMTTDPDYADARRDELKSQNDMVWDLDAITDRQQAIDFLLRFENRLCVYSSYVEKLYSNCRFVVQEEAHCSIHILHGETMGHTGLYLKSPASTAWPPPARCPSRGLRLLIQHYQAKHDHFLPVLAKGDLREHEARMPSQHLQRVDTTRLGHLSELEVTPSSRHR